MIMVAINFIEHLLCGSVLLKAIFFLPYFI